MDSMDFLRSVAWKKLRKLVWGSSSHLKPCCPRCGNALLSELDEMCVDCKLRSVVGPDTINASAEKETSSPPLSELDKAYYFLGLKPSASIEDVKQRYRELIKQCHPDVIKDTCLERRQRAADLFRDIDKAYKVVLKHRNGG